jgi:hypothetical protein
MTNKIAKKLEQKTAKDFHGGKPQIASGALPFWKHDIDADNFLIEHKYTEAKSFSIKKKYFNSLSEEAYKIGKLPMMIVEFIDRPELKIAIIRYEDALALDEYMIEERDGDNYNIKSERACKEE